MAAGCTVVVKPTPVTPLSPLAFCHALIEGGIPAGVINCITGDGAALGAALVAHPDVAKIAMTGSTATGKKILESCGPSLKKVSLELGGHCPAIVCADADLDLAAKIIAYKGFRNMGQSCSTIARVYAHRSVHDALVEKVKAIAEKMTIGDGVTDPAVDLGPMATAEARGKVRAHVDDALEKGAHLIYGGKIPDGEPYAKGFFYLPTILTSATPEMRTMREETFGPVVPFVAFDDLDDAIRQANDIEYGLVSYLFARDYATIARVSEALEAGTICVNHGAVNTNYGPYEGWKDSGFGVELGRRAIYEYLKTKHIKIAPNPLTPSPVGGRGGIDARGDFISSPVPPLPSAGEGLGGGGRGFTKTMLLTPIQSRVAFADALENHYAILAVNADSPAAVTDCLEAALAADAPIIIETSLWQLTGRSFGAGDALTGLARYLAELATVAASERYQSVPVIFHTDHIKGAGTKELLTAALCGVGPFKLTASTVSLDSSELSEAENIALLCDLGDAARAANVAATFEMEAGVDDGLTPLDVTERLLGGVEAKHPGKVWLWAPGVGTRHGFSKAGFPAFSAEHVAAQREFAESITRRKIGIALHGSSGLPAEQLQAAVAAGVVKVNWSSESLLIRSQAARAYYADYGERLEADHPQFKAAAMDNGVAAFVAAQYVPKVTERIRLLGGAGRGDRIVGARRGLTAFPVCTGIFSSPAKNLRNLLTVRALCYAQPKATCFKAGRRQI